MENNYSGLANEVKDFLYGGYTASEMRKHENFLREFYDSLPKEREIRASRISRTSFQVIQGGLSFSLAVFPLISYFNKNLERQNPFVYMALVFVGKTLFNVAGELLRNSDRWERKALLERIVGETDPERIVEEGKRDYYRNLFGEDS